MSFELSKPDSSNKKNQESHYLQDSLLPDYYNPGNYPCKHISILLHRIKVVINDTITKKPGNAYPCDFSQSCYANQIKKSKNAVAE